AAPLTGTHTDLFGANQNGANAFYRNRGDGTFEDCAALLNLSDAGESSQCVAAVDADGDGRLDLCWGNRDGSHRLMIRVAEAAWRDRSTPALAMPSTACAV